ncbi:MAG: hypothetical protein ACOYXO_12480 [Chloroflexota bacterium]
MAIELWFPPKTRPSFVLVDEDGNVEVGAELTDEEVYCDLCNAEVPLNPAPMVGGNVLCLDCLPKIEPGWEKQVTPLLKLIWQTQMASE